MSSATPLAIAERHKRVIIHAGLPKTGSTSIQSFLRKHRSELEAHARCVYPLVKDPARQWPGDHTDLLRALHVNKRSEYATKDLENWRRVVERFIASSEVDTLLISHESFSEGRRRIDMPLLRELLCGLPIEIVLYLRGAEDWLTSLYEQRVRSKSGRLGSSMESLPMVNRYVRHGFEGVVRDMQQIFEPVRMHIIPFDAVKKSRVLMPSFFAAAGLPTLSRPEKIANERIAYRHICFLRRLNEVDIDLDSFLQLKHWIKVANHTAISKPQARIRLLSADMAAKVHRRFQQDIAYFREHHGVELPAAVPLAGSGGESMRLSEEDWTMVHQELSSLPGFTDSAAESIMRSIRQRMICS